MCLYRHSCGNARIERTSVSTGKESWPIDHAFCVAEVTQSTNACVPLVTMFRSNRFECLAWLAPLGCGKRGTQGRGGCWAAVSQTLQQLNLNNTDFIYMMIPNVLRVLPFNQNQPLKKADDQYSRILKNKLIMKTSQCAPGCG